MKTILIKAPIAYKSNEDYEDNVDIPAKQTPLFR
jgi:hypothetical protein